MRAERLGIAPPANLIDVVLPGCEDKARELVRQGSCNAMTGWEVPLGGRWQADHRGVQRAALRGRGDPRPGLLHDVAIVSPIANYFDPRQGALGAR